jgi:hypothetical protein
VLRASRKSMVDSCLGRSLLVEDVFSGASMSTIVGS